MFARAPWLAGMRGPCVLGIAVGFAGCAEHSSINPVRWWYGLQGGVIAEQRPPPPNADMPYPNLGTVPAKPAMPDPAARQRISSALASDRASAQYSAKLIPLPAVPRSLTPAGSPGTSAPASAGGSGDATGASASLEAATAPPHPAVPAAPRQASHEIGYGMSAAHTLQPGAAALPPSTPLDTGPMPEVPLAPPPPPSLPGYVIPATKPTPPPAAPPEAPKVDRLTSAGAQPVALGFRTNSAVLTPDGVAALKALAARRGAHRVQAVGFGEAEDASPQVQAEGITLALARARAIVAALNLDGVPPDAIRMSAEAGGRGGAARLIE